MYKQNIIKKRGRETTAFVFQCSCKALLYTSLTIKVYFATCMFYCFLTQITNDCLMNISKPILHKESSLFDIYYSYLPLSKKYDLYYTSNAYPGYIFSCYVNTYYFRIDFSFMRCLLSNYIDLIGNMAKYTFIVKPFLTRIYSYVHILQLKRQAKVSLNLSMQ